MPSKLYQQLNGASQSQPNNLDGVKNMINMLKNNGNPMQMLQSMAGTNPQLGQVLSMLNGSGMSAKQMFMQMAQQRGVDPNSIIDMLK
jgi:hypothetical protein